MRVMPPGTRHKLDSAGFFRGGAGATLGGKVAHEGRGAPCCGDYRQISGVSRTGLTVSISCSCSASFNQVPAIWSKVVLFRRASSRVSNLAADLRPGSSA